jgi:hypothetical protein
LFSARDPHYNLPRPPVSLPTGNISAITVTKFANCVIITDHGGRHYFHFTNDGRSKSKRLPSVRVIAHSVPGTVLGTILGRPNQCFVASCRDSCLLSTKRLLFHYVFMISNKSSCVIFVCPLDDGMLFTTFMPPGVRAQSPSQKLYKEHT